MNIFEIERPVRTCVACGGPVRIPRRGAMGNFCSGYCRSVAAQTAKTGHSRTCATCGSEYIKEYGKAGWRKYCSASCKQEAIRIQGLPHGNNNNHTRRARMRGAIYESVNPLKVFARAKWRCEICGVSTPKRLRGTRHDRAPEIDHILPLSQGGPHTYTNVQCTCRLCNNKKGSRAIGQMPLEI